MEGGEGVTCGGTGIFTYGRIFTCGGSGDSYLY